MLYQNEEKKLPEKQKKILQLLLKTTYMQNELAKAVKISGAGLLYHLKLLEKNGIIHKKTITKVGNVTLNRISINANSVQKVRKILGLTKKNFTLISGFGKDSELGQPYTIPATAKLLLGKEDYNIQRVIAFVTPESNINKAKEILKIDRFIEKSIQDYRNPDSELMNKLELIIQEEQKEAEIILDLTPLTKLLTIKFLEFSYKYDIPSFYLGKKESGENSLIWLH